MTGGLHCVVAVSVVVPASSATRFKKKKKIFPRFYIDLFLLRCQLERRGKKNAKIVSPIEALEERASHFSQRQMHKSKLSISIVYICL